MVPDTRPWPTELRLAKANHWVQQEYPAEVNTALLSFLEE